MSAPVTLLLAGTLLVFGYVAFSATVLLFAPVPERRGFGPLEDGVLLLTAPFVACVLTVTLLRRG